MSRKYKFHNPEGVYFVSFAVQAWVDVFTCNEYKNILIENLDYCQKHKGLEIFAWCIMTNHVHLIIRSEEVYLLPDILRDYKSAPAKATTGLTEYFQNSLRIFLKDQNKEPHIIVKK